MAASTGEALERFARILVKSVAITTLGGMFAGSVAFSIVASGPGDAGKAVRALPLTAALSIPIAAPFGIVCGLVAALALELLLRSRFRAASGRAWIAAGGGAGLVLGGACPLFLRAVGFNIDDATAWGVFGGLGASAGACCGALLGWLGGAEARRSLRT